MQALKILTKKLQLSQPEVFKKNRNPSFRSKHTIVPNNILNLIPRPNEGRGQNFLMNEMNLEIRVRVFIIGINKVLRFFATLRMTNT